MKNNQKNQKCSRPNCEGKIAEKEIYHDISPTDAFKETSFSIKVCDNKDCGIRKDKIEEFSYWKKLSDELEIPDLKYWSLRYSRGDRCFWIVVRDIQEDGVEWGTPKHVWQEPISSGVIGKALSKLSNNIVEQNDYEFRELITKSLKLIATEIKKTRKKEKNE